MKVSLQVILEPHCRPHPLKRAEQGPLLPVHRRGRQGAGKSCRVKYLPRISEIPDPSISALFLPVSLLLSFGQAMLLLQKGGAFSVPLPSSCSQEWGKGVGTPSSPDLPTVLPQSQGCASERLCRKACCCLWVVMLILTTQQERGLSSCSPTYHNHRAGYFQVSNL